MVSLMGEFGMVDRAAVANTLPEAFYDNSFTDELKESGFRYSFGIRFESVVPDDGDEPPYNSGVRVSFQW